MNAILCVNWKSITCDMEKKSMRKSKLASLGNHQEQCGSMGKPL